MEILRRARALPGSTGPAPKRIHRVIDTLVDAGTSVKAYCNGLEVSRQCSHPYCLSVGAGGVLTWAWRPTPAVHECAKQVHTGLLGK